jgi:predicted nucleic acid-binding protein
MTIKIQAHIVDISHDIPRPTDRFFVDTNVWFFLAYTSASQSSSTQYGQVKIYPGYLQRALKQKSALYKCLLSYSELSHIIERSEYEIFCDVRKQKRLPDVKPKDFRHNFSQERAQVIGEIELAWFQVDMFTKENTLTFHVDQAAIDRAQSLIKNLNLDGYDLFFVDAIHAAGITQVISDDIDFGQVPDITVFTANQKLIREAAAQGRLSSRQPTNL